MWPSSAFPSLSHKKYVLMISADVVVSYIRYTKQTYTYLYKWAQIMHYCRYKIRRIFIGTGHNQYIKQATWPQQWHCTSETYYLIYDYHSNRVLQFNNRIRIKIIYSTIDESSTKSGSISELGLLNYTSLDYVYHTNIMNRKITLFDLLSFRD